MAVKQTTIPKEAWKTIDIDTLKPALRKAYDALKAKRAEASVLRDEFEKLVSTEVALPTGKRMAFGYNYGKLSMAVTEAEERKAPKGAVALAAFGTK